jgi:hypothetical protein
MDRIRSAADTMGEEKETSNKDEHSRRRAKKTTCTTIGVKYYEVVRYTSPHHIHT